MNHTESQIQARIVKDLRRCGYFVFMAANDAAGRTSIQKGARLKSMGLYAGMSDLIVILDDGRAVFVEVKKLGGRHSKSQTDFVLLCNEKGWAYCTVNDSESALNFLDIIKNS